MKQKLLLIVVMIGMFMGANAQKVNFGVKAGLNISSLSEYEHPLLYEDAELDNKLGLYAGIFTQIYFTHRLGIETGLYYTQLGGKDKENDYDEQYKVTANPAYLQLPVSVIYKFDLPAKFTLYPSLGLYAGYGLSGKIKTKGMINATDISSKVDYFDDFARKFDFGGTVGLNLQYQKTVLGLGYERSFTRVNKKAVTYGDNAFNSNFRVTLGYIFN